MTTDKEAADAFARILGPGWKVEPVGYREELTPAGIQLAMFDKPEPPKKNAAQLSLFP